MTTIESSKEKFFSYLLCIKRVSKNTYTSYLYDIEQLFSFLNCKFIEEISIDSLRKYIGELKNKNFKTRSICRKLTTIKTFFKFCSAKFGIIDPAINLVFPKAEVRLPRYLSTNEIEHLFNIASLDKTEIGIRDVLILKLLYTTGIRISELCNLKISSIIDKKFLIIEGKGGKERLVPLLGPVVDDLQHYINVTRQIISKNKISDYLFLQKKSDFPLSRSHVHMILKIIGKCADLKIYPHLFRHSIATHMLHSGISLMHIKNILGHEFISSTQIYAATNIEHLKKEYFTKHPRR